ncbi:MAG TPA: EamA family transporter [Anaerolineaceae bacterium]|nr:EamA family transporter [Anaerolineaceae bacterium]HPN50509.1 EamA family transporter [Anaerolineaceae bacterium]
MNSLLLASFAVILWSTLALLGSQVASLPPFLMLGVVFTLTGLTSLFQPRAWRVPFRTLLVGVGGIFGYHFLYFRAFALAPAVEANLINYLWPLLIVVLSPLFIKGIHLRLQHILGGLLGLAGAALIVTQGQITFDTRYLPGYLLAGGAAVTWAVYSLLTKRLPPFPTGSISVFCLISGLLSFTVHLALGGSLDFLVSPGWHKVLLLVLIAAGPMGAAFFFWDAALKRGDPRAIGSLSYLTPLLSTLNLMLFSG